MKINLYLAFIILLVITAICSCSTQEKSNGTKISQKNIQNNIEETKEESGPYHSWVAVQEGNIICYKDNNDLMCQMGTNQPFRIVENIMSEFMIYDQCIYYVRALCEDYFASSPDNTAPCPYGDSLNLHKVDLNTREDIIFSYDFGKDCSFICGYKNAIYLYIVDSNVKEPGIYMITKNKCERLCTVDFFEVEFTAFVKGQLFITKEIPKKAFQPSAYRRASIYKIDLNTTEKKLEKMTDFYPPDDRIWNAFLSDSDAIYYLNVIDSYSTGQAKEMELVRMDETGKKESLCKETEPITLAFIDNGTVVYYCPEKHIYEK